LITPETTPTLIPTNPATAPALRGGVVWGRLRAATAKIGPPVGLLPCGCSGMSDNLSAARESHLDGLRGAASCAVFFGHLLIALLPSAVTLAPQDVHTRFDLVLGGSPIGVLWNGNAAVCIFFILSGYVLTSLAQRSRLSMAAQLARRYVRLALPMLITVAIPLIIMRLGWMHNAEAVQITRSGWLGSWYQFGPSGRGAIAEMLYGAFATGQSRYNSNLWTMRVELWGSFYIFVLTAMSTNRRLRLICYALFVAWSPFDYYPLFAIGAAFYDFEDVVGLVFAATPIPIVLFFTGLYLCGLPATSDPDQLKWYGWLPVIAAHDNERYWHEIGASLVLLGTIHSETIRAVFSTGVARWLGKISFTLYLIHLPIICSLTAWLVLMTASQIYYLIVTVAGGGTIVATFALCGATVRFIDQWPTKISRWVGRLVDRLTLPAKSEAAPQL
jgi:peptidoglycan/LPS O-acetylase OafA/YrhL